AAGAALLYTLNLLIRRAQRAGTRQTQSLKSLLTRLTDSLQSVKPLKAMAKEELVGTVLESENRRLNRALRREVLSTEALGSLQEPLLATVIAVGIYLAMTQWGLPFAAVTVLAFLLARLLGLLAKAQRYYQRMRVFESAFWSLQRAIQDAREARESEPGGLLPSLHKAVCLEHVSFTFDKTPVLWNASLTIPTGSFVVIIGPSGAGKTTIIDLITGLLCPQQGEIQVDGVALEKIDLKHWRRMIGYVPQETLLLHDTVLNNVTLGDPGMNEADAEAALRAAGAWDFVTQRHQGLRSSVGERGAALSGGQRQRIAIARALVHRPRLLILDEVTNALDRESEVAICRTLQQLRGGMTILAVSHQPALVEAADRVYRLEKGALTLVADGVPDSAVPCDVGDEPTLTPPG
ncbi:MAG: ATP-binding cassette domain-containing protein, partial [Nitrospirota bacterium]|nr:ATP-binding cassette domain-containing protein [Nitrospirota bacterium]